MTAEVVQFPKFYRIAFSDGERVEYVEGARFEHYWQAENALHIIHADHPHLIMWISLPNP